MDTARDKNTLELVEAEELWNMATVDQDGYICPGCETSVFPASYDKEKNKKRPYFTLGPTNKHVPGCDVDGEEKVVKRAKKERVGTPEGFPLPFPNRLTLTDERPVVPSGGGNLPTEQGPVRTGSRARAGSVGGGHHGHTVKTIRPACRAFINYPHDRGHLPFSIDGVPGKTYAEVFWYLRSKKPEHFNTPRHLYYATIRWKSEPVVADSHCELTLNVGEWDAAKKAHKSLSRVRVDWSNWSQTRRDSLIREFEATRNEAAEQAKTSSDVKGWLFFVGTQDAEDPEVFHVNNHRLICCLSAEIVWPARS
ncbi:hypothetical protein [Burkholderia pyrrocinia]|uniref:hypothetical protein n=1 Tax=Burkholderia pyrrocinia TaxID=60550 RepID=UPI00158A8515|nr:hypothetical protein [Burkholderia pyrrocinia]